MQIFWLKRNLRLQDSEPFFESMRAFRKKGKVLPLYCHEPELIQQPDVSRQHQLFIQETLEELDRDFQSIGGKLLQAVGETVDVLDRIHRVQPLTKIWTHQETTQNSQFQRDKAVAAWCADHGVELLELAQNGIARGSQKPELFPPYFAGSVSSKLRDPIGTDLAQRFAPLPFPSCDPKGIPKAAGTDKPLRQKGGRSQAIKNLNRFFTVPYLKQYPFQISSPNTAWQGCSRISTYLAYGIVSDREIFQAVDRVVTDAHSRMNADQFGKFQENARFYLDRLSWRRQYMQTFETRPELEFECMLAQFNGVREADFSLAHSSRQSEKHFTAWKQGLTGFPYIDAAMRFLHQTGWINMRLRATLVSFATMNLWIPTTKVAEYLATEFLDYEPGIHHVIHQIIAGTTEFNELMVYDPVKQGRDHDLDGHFIHKWVPELADVPGSELHDLSKTAFRLSKHAEILGYMPYPEAVVDHRTTAKKAKDRASDLRRSDSDRHSVSAETSSEHKQDFQQSLF
ncbi:MULTISPECIES: FAD-binding domain-containing protein [unclassified Marinobacter]|uniref:FAD-binding domain-containing protein n=1 Tax=unclassified Marinobacter TaxID=83889 RepID=UPI00200D5A1A|nr:MULTISPECIES: FAD-binding domain-containing protein [unclassified Marinobacter]MCL1478463.1 deoxyribodipyrimidine photo-lyase/cryptochrome family protein [Marinobacter sp.]MCL1480423.1 deoxyribodipyrimidine photo-lyase/cryptochrome family protein [Marinobacter sp.]UQG55385.1 deoxyribodipyrimidine photo-lyase/cryptochrome family protein [Marinobacter sp. M4C]UQG64189.1 deoxyribodipyrimidine photo-lyase/cryptochrome family protein [Marinobacter sp. M2C]UQG68468.1 deoxyribodipyrimidine photo-l